MNAAYLTPAITLFNEDGSLDLVSQEKLFNNLIENGVDVSVVQQVMGHANLYTTKRYVHLSDRYLMEKMNAYWAGREGGVPDEATERR